MIKAENNNHDNKIELSNLLYLKKSKVEFREYQVNIAEKCVGANSLVVIPTGLGKTIIALLLAAMTLEKVPKGSKVIVMAPTRPLIDQHYKGFMDRLAISEQKFCLLTGKTPPEERVKLFSNCEILFYTPQTLRNDLVHHRYDLSKVCMMVFDEAHHAAGDYPYPMIADLFKEQNPDGVGLGLTASPGSSKKKIADLCNLLHIPFENIHIRQEKDEDVKDYVKPTDIFKIGVELSLLMKDIKENLENSLEQKLKFLAMQGFVEDKGEILHKKIIRKDLLKLNEDLRKIINGDGDKSAAYSAISLNAQALILFHMIELVDQQGLDVLLEYLEKMNNDARKEHSSKAVKVLAADYYLRQIYIELKKNKEFSPNNLVHPKFPILEKTILEELISKPNSRILVFVKLRDSVKNITNKLKSVSGVKVSRFVGQTSKSKDDKGLSQKQQIEILDLFKDGKYNVLISTNVGEEGLDVAECDLVVFYDIVASEIRFIQRKGRTGRHREGKVVILYCKNTNDEQYLSIVLHKLKKMNINLKNPKELSNPSELNSLYPPEENKINKQSSLSAFIHEATTKKSEVKVSSPQNPVKIEISQSLPMKYGLRKFLISKGYAPDTSNSALFAVELFEKVVLNIYDPKEFSKKFGDQLIDRNIQLRKVYDLVLNVFDFENFQEGFEGEKTLLRKEIQEYGKTRGLKIIEIDTIEEFHFIVLSLLDNHSSAK